MRKNIKMSKCQHCNKLTHSEHLNVFFDLKDYDKIEELMTLAEWHSDYHYKSNNPEEIGKLKCGDIYIHFLCKKSESEE